MKTCLTIALALTLAGCSLCADNRPVRVTSTYTPSETFGAKESSRSYPVIGNPTAGEARCTGNSCVVMP